MYEKRLQKLLDQPPAEPEAPTVTTLPKADSNQNGNTNSDQYSDKEDGEPLGGCWLVGGFIKEKVSKLVAIGP